MTSVPSIEQIVSSASDAAFGRPRLTNVMRATVVEAIVAKALVGWTWCAADYALWDFQREEAWSGREVRLEVKQSARCQSWQTRKPSEICWDIARRRVQDGDVMIDELRRYADIYVLAAHLGEAPALVDHRDAAQWRFFVVPAGDLPLLAKTIGMAAIENMSESVGFEGLSAAVEKCAALVAGRGADLSMTDLPRAVQRGLETR